MSSTSSGLGGAHKRNRTVDLFLTKEVLYQLSYVGLLPAVQRRKRPKHASFRLKTAMFGTFLGAGPY